MDGLSFYVVESASTITSIKHSVYELVNVGISLSLPARKIDTMAGIVSGSRRNLDDLKRIDSMLKGYLNSRRLAAQAPDPIHSELPDLQAKINLDISAQ